MNTSFLMSIEKLTKRSVNQRKKSQSLESLRCDRTPLDFERALVSQPRSIIAEVKKMSPSLGELNLTANPATLARTYAENGAAAVSVLTEEHFFKGTLNDLKEVRLTNHNLPLLQKDFVIDEYQIHEAKALGADCVLLIVALLGKNRTHEFYHLAKSLGLTVLVEIHNEEELELANALQCSLIGINNRNLHTLEVSLDVSRSLISKVHRNAIVITESGISSNEEINELSALGFRGFLIGSSLMKSDQPGSKLRALLEVSYAG